MKSLKIALAILVVVVLGVLALASFKPDAFSVQRSLSIKASADKLHLLINDFHAWAAWSPYEKRDPAMQRSFSGAPSGAGSIYEWRGNEKVGAGRMEILESMPARIGIKLDFIKPFEGHNRADFSLQPEANGTRVTWTMSGPTPFVSKLMQVFFDLDSMIGKDFEAGLANLKLAAEK